MCSSLFCCMFGFPTITSHMETNYMVSTLPKWLLFFPHSLWLVVTAKVLLIVRLMPTLFINTFLLSVLYDQDHTPPLPPCSAFFHPSFFDCSDHKALEEIKPNFLLENSGDFWCWNNSFYGLSTYKWTWIYCQEKKHPWKWGKDWRIIMYPNHKFN